VGAYIGIAHYYAMLTPTTINILLKCHKKCFWQSGTTILNSSMDFYQIFPLLKFLLDPCFTYKPRLRWDQKSVEIICKKSQDLFSVVELLHLKVRGLDEFTQMSK
jgi:hypothetical protein